MEKEEILRRINILSKKKLPRVDRRLLTGGMQERLHRREAIRYVKDTKQKKEKLINKLKDLEKGNFLNTLGEEQETFDEPTFRKIRSKRGFY